MPGNSLLHRLDPRTKFLSLILLMIVIFTIQVLPGLALMAGFFFLALTLSGMSWGYVFRGVRPFLWLFLFTGAIHFFFTPGPSLPLFPLGFIDVTWPGLIRGGFVASQLVLAILFSSLMTLTTAPLRLAFGLEKLLSPLKRFRVPVEDFSLMMMLAIRFIPILIGEADRIRKAQTARGIDFESGNFWQRARNLIPLLTPLLHSVFKRADDLALALLARGYVRGAPRTSLVELKLAWRDYGVLAAVMIVSVLGWKV